MGRGAIVVENRRLARYCLYRLYLFWKKCSLLRCYMPSYDFEKWFIAIRRNLLTHADSIPFHLARWRGTFSIVEGLGTATRSRVVSLVRVLFERGCQEVVRADGYEERHEGKVIHANYSAAINEGLRRGTRRKSLRSLGDGLAVAAT